MEEPVSDFEEQIVASMRNGAGRFAWNDFCGRAREVVDVDAAAVEEAFWRVVSGLAERVGPEPLLVVSNRAEGRIVRRLLYGRGEGRPDLKVEQNPRDQSDRTYIATVEDVDVCGADFPPGTAWLFSARLLQAIRYGSIDPEGHRVSLDFELGDDMKGTLRARFRQHAVWEDLPVFELHAPDPDGVDEA